MSKYLVLDFVALKPAEYKCKTIKDAKTTVDDLFSKYFRKPKEAFLKNVEKSLAISEVPVPKLLEVLFYEIANRNGLHILKRNPKKVYKIISRREIEDSIIP